jgi:hypothetical protein
MVLQSLRNIIIINMIVYTIVEGKAVKKISAIWLSLLLMFSSVVIIVNFPVVSGADLIVGDDESVYVVSGYETWDNVIVLTSGKLIVPSGTTLNATNIFLQGTSIAEIINGSVILYNPLNAGDVMFNGTCGYFNVTYTSTIEIRGSDGYADTSSPGPYTAYKSVSMGGNAELNITATQGLRIENSMINVTGGNGFDLLESSETACNTWTNGGSLKGYVAAGGDATMYFNSTNALSQLIISDSSLKAMGGEGGDAADGGAPSQNTAGKGGGYTNGGGVSENVGAGGRVFFDLYAENKISLYNGTIDLIGGKGGDAGDASYIEWWTVGYNAAGGGGGGYSGGDGSPGLSYTPGENGGNIKGNVGSGGEVVVKINSSNLALNSFDLTFNGGDGGNAGNGGTTESDSGAGGGGYTSGGGGSYWHTPGGNGGTVTDNVGAGGYISVIFDISQYMVIEESTISAIAGNGGQAGNGGNSDPTQVDDGGGGGGGYSGGGGGGAGGHAGGEAGHNGGDGGSVSGNVGKGGDINLTFISNRFISINASYTLQSGNGGDGGVCGTNSGNGGGGGGGAYSAGGGAGRGYSGQPNGVGGSGGIVSGLVGDGGNVTFSIETPKPTISNTTQVILINGNGGNGLNSSAPPPVGGEGLGRATSAGGLMEYIPMSIPMLLTPLNNSIIMSSLTFTWLHLHNSTTNGDLVEYVIQIDDDSDFSSPIKVNVTTLPTYSPSLSDGTYYWRVKANYSTPPGSSAGWSDAWVFTISFLAPIDLVISVNLIAGDLILDWTPPNSPTLDHYVIYRSLNPHDFNFSTPYALVDPFTTTWVDPDTGEGSNDNNYFYIVRGVNETGFEEKNMNIVGKHVSWLKGGWNLFSIPLKSPNESIGGVLSPIVGSYYVVYWYDAGDGRWRNSNDDLTEIDHTMGLWIYMNTQDKLITVGSLSNSTIHLTEGWNLVGYPSFFEKSVNDIKSDLPSLDSMYRYNSSDNSDHWKHHKEGKTLGNDLTTMKTGFGYWIYVTSDSAWHVEY